MKPSSFRLIAWAGLLIAAALLGLILLPALATDGDYGINTGKQPSQEESPPPTSPPTQTPIFSPTPPPPTDTPTPAPTNTPLPPNFDLTEEPTQRA